VQRWEEHGLRASNDFHLLETLISPYLLTGYTKRDPARMKQLKYLLIGTAELFFPLWVSLLYAGCRGETQLSAIAAGLPDAGQSLGLSFLSSIFVIAGVAFKISAAPSTSGHQTFTKALYPSCPFIRRFKSSWICLNNRITSNSVPLLTDEWHFVFTALPF